MCVWGVFIYYIVETEPVIFKVIFISPRMGKLNLTKKFVTAIKKTRKVKCLVLCLVRVRAE